MKEIRFEVRTRDGGAFVAPIGSVEGVSETVHVPSDVLLQLWRLTGPPEDVAQFSKLIAEPGRHPHLGNVVLHETPRSLHFVSKWDDPCADGDPTLENLFATLAWSQVLLRIRATEGHIRVRALDEDATTLRELFRRIEARFGDQWPVRLRRFGDLGRDEGDPSPVLSPEDLAVLELALERGFYDQPKRCGLRDLGDELGVSKTAVSRKLRRMQRQALEQLREQAARWPTEPESDRPNDLSSDMSQEG